MNIYRSVKLVFCFSLLLTLIGSCNIFDGSVYHGPKSDHFDGVHFFNQEAKNSGSSFWHLSRFLLSNNKGFWYDWVNEESGKKPAERVSGDSLVVTFINHATVLIQTDGINILTDPIWSDVISPIAYIGWERHRPPGVKFEDLPPIDIVLISHNHYDHLDLSTLKRLKKSFDPLMLLPLGNKELMDDNDLKNSQELDWWQEINFKKNTKISFVPSRHFSGRGLSDRNMTLWGGYVIQTSGGPIYFAGDTGFGIHFEQIFKKFGAMRLSLLPISPYRPHWFMSDIHESPEEAAKAHLILKSKTSIAIHWGTFEQADNGMYEPVFDMRNALTEYHISAKDFIVPKHGNGILIK
jgi:L-ascorbate metabolism protein UlaG (beta-lactamase superfamily)